LLIFAFGLALIGPSCAGLNHPPPRDKTIAKIESELAGDFNRRSLRVATYNVHMESASSIARAIRESAALRRADVLFLQEIEAHPEEPEPRALRVARELKMHAAYAPGYGLKGSGSHGVAILSRFPLEDLELIELPYYHVVINSARRVALAATIKLSDQSLRVYSVHLDNRINPENRMRQLAPVFAAADAVSGPVIIAGDLNTSPFCWGAGVFPLPCGMQADAVEEQARKHGFQTPAARSGATSKWLAMKLDAIYTRGLKSRGHGVAHRVRISDHLPLWLDLALPRRGAMLPKLSFCENLRRRRLRGLKGM
jgi:endonuclease/exonuclease/phosphatase family metal-dependent hydrolase